MTTEPTRGERNNNPCNIENAGIAWDGLADPPADAGGYCRFTTPELGIRAGALDILDKWRRDGLRTVTAIIGRYAPPSDNDTAAYVEDVAAHLGVSTLVEIDLEAPGVLQVFVTAVIRHENGRCIYPPETIADGVAAALQVKG